MTQFTYIYACLDPNTTSDTLPKHGFICLTGETGNLDDGMRYYNVAWYGVELSAETISAYNLRFMNQLRDEVEGE